MLKTKQLSIRLALYALTFGITARIVATIYFSRGIFLTDLIMLFVSLTSIFLLRKNRIATEKILNKKDERILSLHDSYLESQRLAACINMHLALQEIRSKFFQNILDRADKLYNARQRNDEEAANLQTTSILSMRKLLSEFDETCVSALAKHVPLSVMTVDDALEVVFRFKNRLTFHKDDGEELSIYDAFNLQALEFDTDTLIRYVENGKLELTEAQKMMLQKSLSSMEEN